MHQPDEADGQDSTRETLQLTDDTKDSRYDAEESLDDEPGHVVAH